MNKKQVVALSDLKAFASNIAKTLTKGSVVCLTGDLGAGKTAFSSALINEYARLNSQSAEHNEIIVTSPTYNITSKYDMPNGIAIWHLDLYRISDIYSEAPNIDFYDALSEIAIIEWPQIAKPLLENTIDIHIAFTQHDNEREFDVVFTNQL